MILRAIRNWKLVTGRPPTFKQWNTVTGHYPHASTVRRMFGSWSAAIEEAGFEVPPKGRRYAQKVAA
jgi:hypothetical protein